MERLPFVGSARSLATMNLHVRPLLSETWLDLLEPWLTWDDDAELCLSERDLDEVPTVLISDEEPLRALDAGFAGVVSLQAEPERIVAALRAVEAGLTVYERYDAGYDRPELTERESQVLELLAQGFSNREIGAHLSISSHTAKFHVQALLEKLDATTRTEAAVRAARMLII